MGKLKKILYTLESGESIYVPKKVLDGINKTAIITNQYIVQGSGEDTQIVFITKALITKPSKVETECVKNDQRGRLVIEYHSKKGNARGVIEIYDMGPD